jgi:hypothetical protein
VEGASFWSSLGAGHLRHVRLFVLAEAYQL